MPSNIEVLEDVKRILIDENRWIKGSDNEVQCDTGVVSPPIVDCPEDQLVLTHCLRGAVWSAVGAAPEPLATENEELFDNAYGEWEEKYDLWCESDREDSDSFDLPEPDGSEPEFQSWYVNSGVPEKKYDPTAVDDATWDQIEDICVAIADGISRITHEKSFNEYYESQLRIAKGNWDGNAVESWIRSQYDSFEDWINKDLSYDKLSVASSLIIVYNDTSDRAIDDISGIIDTAIEFEKSKTLPTV